MIDFEQIVWVSPAFNKRDPDPKKDYGISACRITFILKGPKGAVQFMVGTDWYLPDDQRENRYRQYNYNARFDNIQPSGWDVGYHSPKPMYNKQTPMANCTLMDPCYYDGSSLLADEWVPHFIEGGTNWLWPKLEEQYRLRFETESSP